jgi:hypothetical protein
METTRSLAWKSDMCIVSTGAYDNSSAFDIIKTRGLKLTLSIVQRRISKDGTWSFKFGVEVLH